MALAEKLEDGNDKDGKKKAIQGPVIATEDVQTYERLRELAEEVGLEVSFERIPLGGNVRLNRNNLVVICGPRLSPLIEQILEGDPHLRFGKDDDGWYLTDRNTGQVYRSPMDRGENADIAYFGLHAPTAREPSCMLPASTRVAPVASSTGSTRSWPPCTASSRRDGSRPSSPAALTRRPSRSSRASK
ncbi:hypothetical protein ACFQ3Z_45740 [Streptomyces nogalater]